MKLVSSLSFFGLLFVSAVAANDLCTTESCVCKTTGSCPGYINDFDSVDSSSLGEYEICFGSVSGGSVDSDSELSTITINGDTLSLDDIGDCSDEKPVAPPPPAATSAPVESTGDSSASPSAFRPVVLLVAAAGSAAWITVGGLV